MNPAISPAAWERCIERSRLRRRALILTSSLSEAFPRQLAKALGVDSGRLRALMHGGPPDYAEALGLVTLGLVAQRETPHGSVYTITDLGRRKARQLTARETRRDAIRRLLAAQRADPRPWDGAPTGVPTPAASADTGSFRWSVEE